MDKKLQIFYANTSEFVKVHQLKKEKKNFIQLF